MQTNLADPAAVGMMESHSCFCTIRTNKILITDPLSRYQNLSVPKRWKIQYLDSDNNWIMQYHLMKPLQEETVQELFLGMGM
jgi:hypothetical protein